MNKFLILFATVFGVGKLPKFPGTWCSAITLVVAVPVLHLLSFNWNLYFAIGMGIFLLGVVAAQAHQTETGKHDAPEVVIDEFAGMWFCLLVLSQGSLFGDFRIDVVVLFVLFRFFDIVKPWPISFIERSGRHGAHAMGDDLVAALFTMAAGYGLGYLI